MLSRPVERLRERFDVAIVGGGITGIWVAREAASRGLKVALVDRGDFGAETSAATTKYIHGGIRYLEQYDFGVVRESLRERRILALGAPHLVEQTKFIMPAWRWSKPGAPILGAGMALYDLLSYDRNREAPSSLRIPHPRWMSKKKLLKSVPWLEPSGLLGAFAYHDTLNVHPERLLLAYAKSAEAAGAVLVNHCRADAFVVDHRGEQLVVEGIRATDLLNGESIEVHAGVIVNAAGPWIDSVLATLGRDAGVGVDRSKGVHVLTRPIGGGTVRDAVFARAKSGRHVIVSPWMGKSFIGPTDTPMGGEEIRADRDDVRSILDTVNSTMGRSERPLTADDVELTTVGVRPLIKAPGSEGTYTASRRHELYHHVKQGIENVWTIGGGKWTTARATAEEMVDELFRHELKRLREVKTNSRRGAAFGTFAWARDAGPYLADAGRELVEAGLSTKSAEIVARLYGTEYVDILHLVLGDRRLAEALPSGDIAAQVVFAVSSEGARTLSDIIDRRLIAGTVGRVDRESLEWVARFAAPLLGWDASRAEREVSREDARRRAADFSRTA
ncbi:MAG: glycerol-3-phosphate dehydrogenase/oxidase [Actinobacteria bacterium]|nr:glycerol-3-phosphate dehydrogenase/oxidase [Actinomycetota bacterium]NBP54093.1 glycerol-3-phosphate dehydrogenase/oxidase [Actinomycetota bacterium]